MDSMGIDVIGLRTCHTCDTAVRMCNLKLRKKTMMYPCKQEKCLMLTINLLPLTQGKYAIVDTADYEWLNKWRWYAAKCGNRYYAKRIEYPQVLMHRLVCNTPKGYDTDHIDGITLDNRKGNLRQCTKAENQMNREKTKVNKFGEKGIRQRKSGQKWSAQITYQGKAIHLGSFSSKEQAARAYDVKATELFGEFARLNVLES